MNVSLQDGFLQIFNVDHGQCALLTIPGPAGTKRVMIDCGHAVNFKGSGKPWYLGQHLQAMGINWIDLLIATNYDEDHMSGFPDLMARKIGIGCILGNPTVAPETIVQLKTEDGMGNGIKELAQVLAFRRNMHWAQTPPAIPGLDLSYFWNPYPHFDDENNLSLVALLTIQSIKFLFPGDMEKKGFLHILRTFRLSAMRSRACMCSSPPTTDVRMASAKTCSTCMAATPTSWSSPTTTSNTAHRRRPPFTRVRSRASAGSVTKVRAMY